MNARPGNVVQVEFGPVEEARRVVLAALGEAVSPAQAARLASVVTARLRNAGLLGGVERHYSAATTGLLLSRSPEHVVAQIKLGRFGVCYRDDGGWLVPESGVQGWLAARVFSGSQKLTTAKENGRAA